MNERIRKIRTSLKKNVNENADLYFMYGVGMAAGIAATLVLRKKAPSFATQFNQWLLDMERQGVHVYGLNELQSDIWQQVWPQVRDALTTTTVAEVTADVVAAAKTAG